MNIHIGLKIVDCALIFDIGNHSRLGEISKILSDSRHVKSSIDHHPSNSRFFDVNFLDIAAPATGFLFGSFLNQLIYI